MCDACVMNAVRDRMLSRRDLFRGSAAATAAAALATVAAPPALAAGHGGVADMTHAYDESFPTFSGAPGITYDKKYDIGSDGYNLYVLSIDEHTGTHIDAPLHFSADGASVDQLPVADLVVPLAVVDIREKAAADPDAQVTPDDLKAWIEANGAIPERACVAMLSGWAEKVGTDGFRNADDSGAMHFPGFHPEAAQMLLDETTAAAIAVDTLSLDHGISADFATHYLWLPAGRYGIECLAGLDAMPATGATLMVGAPKHRRGTGGPARIFALS
ncbi:cyclase family protein [Algicella marina]|uniref:Cyclase family protein n=1 Tax=Algicella marina TaxID=2683284 RepID=A0A6P1T570_9RHOB|nr:cyclase family protein [Algicella marina]QHQ36823.1 cyclase family protein [Algicella marina]